jgi:acyl-CoA synthetase (AMP-forming)/AMP-acid ligase II
VASSSIDELTEAARFGPSWTWMTAESRSRFTSKGNWQDSTWSGDLHQWFQDNPGATAVIDEQVTLTVADVVVAANRLKAELRDLGVAPGDVVSLLIPNWWEFAVIHAAVTSMGAVVNPMLPTSGRTDIAHVMHSARPKVVFVAHTYRDRNLAEIAVSVRDELAIPSQIISVRGDTSGQFDKIVETPTPNDTIDEQMGVINPDSPDTLLFTSGTEALPKGVIHTHRSSQFGLRAFLDDVLKLPSGSTVFMPSPICHATGLQWGLRAAVHVRAPLVLMDKWNPARAVDLVLEHECCYTLAATPFIVDLMAEWEDRGLGPSPLHAVVSGGTAIPRHLVARCQQVLGTPLLSVFGASETYVTTATRPDDSVASMASDGRALPGVELAVVGPDGETLPPGEEGEIITRGPHVFAGYLGDPELTRRAFRGEWYRFGDLGILDEDGCLRVSGRIKDIVIRGGQNISVAEVEEMLIQHPGVAQVAVVGYPDERLGERSCAVVVPSTSPVVTLDELTDFLRERGLATYKLPERLWIVDALPQTATGKVQKAILRENLKD